MHIPVMTAELLEALAIRPEGLYLDMTVGGAGHSAAILQRLTSGRLIAMDRDPLALELARHYAALPKEQRPRTLTFLMFPDHHHGEVAHRMKGGIDQTYDWNRVALKLTLEHPSETLLYMYNSDLTATNALSAVRWNALGSVEFERMVFDQLREFGVSVYGVEDTQKNGNYAPSFHIINHVVYHTTLDTPEMVPAEGMQRSVRAFAAIIDRVNAMTLEQLRGPGFPPKDGRGTVKGPIGM